MNLRKSVIVTALVATASLGAAFPAAAAAPRSLPDPTGSISVAPPVEHLDTNGTAGFTAVIVGNDLLPNETYLLDSPSLRAMCGTTNLPSAATTDFTGHFTTVLTAAGCVPGAAVVEAAETTSPFQTQVAFIGIEG